MQPGAAALVMFPEVFQKPRDEYLYALLRKLAEDEGKDLSAPLEDQSAAQVIDVYLGNLHVSPISRLWNTQSMQSVTMTDEPKQKRDDEDEDDGEQAKGRGRKLALKNKQKAKKTLEGRVINFETIHQMKNDFSQLAEDKIEKQALMEVLFGTQIWSEPYIRNPFLYITDNEHDWAGEQGVHLRDHFKKVFYLNYKKYQTIFDQVVPKELLNIQMQEQTKRFESKMMKKWIN